MLKPHPFFIPQQRPHPVHLTSSPDPSSSAHSGTQQLQNTHHTSHNTQIQTERGEGVGAWEGRWVPSIPVELGRAMSMPALTASAPLHVTQYLTHYLTHREYDGG